MKTKGIQSQQQKESNKQQLKKNEQKQKIKNI
jgi:hypothetical protein